MRVVAVMLAVLAASSCATVPTGPLKAGEVRVARLKVPDQVSPGGYQVKFEGLEKQNPDIVLRQGCFMWVTSQFSDGPYCSSVVEEAASRSAQTWLSTRNPNTYTLYGHITYSYGGSERVSNTVAATLNVR